MPCTLNYYRFSVVLCQHVLAELVYMYLFSISYRYGLVSFWFGRISIVIYLIDIYIQFQLHSIPIIKRQLIYLKLAINISLGLVDFVLKIFLLKAIFLAAYILLDVAGLPTLNLDIWLQTCRFFIIFMLDCISLNYLFLHSITLPRKTKLKFLMRLILHGEINIK